MKLGNMVFENLGIDDEHLFYWNRLWNLNEWRSMIIWKMASWKITKYKTHPHCSCFVDDTGRMILY